MDSSRKIFNDPIHGNIELHPLCVKIVDTPQFQRLRFIKQMGGVYFVYPGAAHNRFEHSIGVCHLAGRLVRALKDRESEALNDVEITPKDVEVTDKDVEITDKDVEITPKDVEITDKDVEITPKDVEITDKDEKITNKDVLCVEIAALCHDLGHGPFSHLFDRKIIPALREDRKGDNKWEHENGSVDMLRYIVKENKLGKEFEDADITPLDLKFIEELIVGRDGISSNKKEKFKELLRDTPGITSDTRYEDVKDKLKNEPSFKNVDTDAQREQYFNESVADLKYFVECGKGTTPETFKEFEVEYKKRTKKKEFLFEILSNKRNGIDVDKWDYFARDCKMLGIGSNFDHNRLIAFSRVINVKGKRQICYRDKEAANLYDMFHTRYLLHTRACKHKATCIIEYMIAEALVLADEFIKLPGHDGKPCKMSEAIDDMKAYSLLNDDVIYTILSSTGRSLKLKKSKEILHRVLKRDLYKFVGEKRFADDTFKDEDAVKADMEIDDSDVIVDVANINYGKQGENPIDCVNFYSKEDPNNAKPRDKDDVSLLLPKAFAEKLVRVYFKDPKDPQNPEIQKQKNESRYTDLKRKFNNWSNKTSRGTKRQKIAH